VVQIIGGRSAGTQANSSSYRSAAILLPVFLGLCTMRVWAVSDISEVHTTSIFRTKLVQLVSLKFFFDSIGPL
jgi:hypothetical protein